MTPEATAERVAEESVEEQPRALEIGAGTLVWLGLGTMFVALRLAGVLAIPTGGAELDHLAGAWQAHVGNTDDRFVPTLFQAVTAWLFSISNSEMLPRTLALAASLSIPFALYRLRDLLSEAGALAALLILAIDPVSILLGSTAWAGALDVALTLWLIILVRTPALPKWSFGLAGLLVATAGPVLLPVVLAYAATRLWRQRYPNRTVALWCAGGVVVGLLLGASSFGFGLQDPVLPPILAFSQGFEGTWSTESTRYLALLYSAPLIALAGAAACFRIYECWSEQDWPEDTVALLGAFALSVGWLVLSGADQNPVPLAAIGVTGALVLGRELPAAVAALQRVSWRHAALPLAALLAAAFVAEAYVVDWARIDRVGKDRDQLIVTGLVIAALASAGLLASNRRTAAALFVPLGLAAALPMLAGASGVAFGGANEPLPSPVSTIQGREIRDIALQARQDSGGPIVIHPNFEEAATWPFRDSGEIVIASRVPPTASVLVWPIAEPAPDGFSILEGNWSLLERRTGPDGGFLDYLRWLTNRNSLLNTIDPVAVYLRTTP